MDIYNLSGFQWWCKKQRNTNLFALAFFILFTVLFGSTFVYNLKSNQIDSANINNNDMFILVIIFLILFLVSLSLLKTTLSYINVKVNECYYGIITNFYIHREVRNGKNKRYYYIVANVNGKEMDVKCLFETYQKAQIGQQIVLFTIQGRESLHCVHPDM